MKATPPLSQSRESKLVCAEFYSVTEIDGVETPPSVYSDRGDEVHHVMAQYALGCAKREVPSDWELFDQIAEAVGPEAGAMLDGMRDNLVIDWEHLFCVETWLGLKEDLSPNVCQKGSEAARLTAYEGTPDAIYFTEMKNDDYSDGVGTKAYIPDFKSHWRPFDADTFQAKLYPFLVFQHFPEIQEVMFELIFTRYKSARRSVTYTRDDVVKLAWEIERARRKQTLIHERAKAHGKWDYSTSEYPLGVGAGSIDVPREPQGATPGSHCIYCPHLAKGTCPLGSTNPYGMMTLEERLKQVVYLDQARKHQLEIIKSFVDASRAPVSFEAGDQKYTASFAASESGYFPLVPTVSMLSEWIGENPEDKTLWERLRVGSTELKSKLKAKKRAILDQRLRDEVMVKETSVRFGIRKEGEEDGISEEV
jgi:hypothetical protein